MKGSEYLGIAVGEQKIEPLDLENDLEGLTRTAMINNFANSSLMVMLRSLYGQEGAPYVAPENNTQLFDVLTETDEIRKLSARKVREDTGPRRHGLSSKTVQPIRPLGADIDPALLGDMIKADLETTRSQLQLASTFTMGRALLAGVNHARKRPDKTLNHAKQIKDAIGENKRYTAGVMSPFGFYIDVTHDDRGRVVDVTPSARSVVRQIPDWLKQTELWNDEISDLVGIGLLEYDSYLAAIEWAKQSKGTLLPIFAPDITREGSLEQGAKNPHANLLLCDLSEDRIIPVQVTRGNIGLMRDRYIDGMEFIGPSNLGLTTMNEGIFRIKDPSGRPYIAATTTTRYGTHIVNFLRKNGTKNGSAKKDLAIEQAAVDASATFDKITATGK